MDRLLAPRKGLNHGLDLLPRTTAHLRGRAKVRSISGIHFGRLEPHGQGTHENGTLRVASGRRGHLSARSERLAAEDRTSLWGFPTLSRGETKRISQDGTSKA